MKVRWTDESVRLRITPDELEALRRGEPVATAIAFPGGGTWGVRVDPAGAAMALLSRAGTLVVELAPDDVARLAEPEREGIYRPAGPGTPRVLVEKDFPCAHPHADEAGEPATPRFAPTAAFLARRGLDPEGDRDPPSPRSTRAP